MNAQERVYTIQCRTWTVARQLCGVEGSNGLALKLDISRALTHPEELHGLHLFRAKRAYRTEAAANLRRAVAAVMREERK